MPDPGMDPTRDREPRIRIGGLYRCCLDREKWPESPNEGDALKCEHGCGTEVIYRDGAWEWRQ